MSNHHSRRRPRLAPAPVPVKLPDIHITKPFKETFSNLSNWKLYDSVGHDGQGVRTPNAISAHNNLLEIYGGMLGYTGGMQLLGHSVLYGTVSVVALTPPGAGVYHPVALLWGEGSGSSVDAVTGEIDFMEFWNNPARDVNGFTLHYGDGSQMISKDHIVPTNLWNTYSVRWTPDEIVGSVNGSEYFRTVDTAKFPKVPMDVCLQLDWFPEENTTSGAASMLVRSVEIQPL